MKYLILLLISTNVLADYIATPIGPHTPNQSYLIQTRNYTQGVPNLPALKPICQGHGKDYSTMNWLACFNKTTNPERK